MSAIEVAMSVAITRSGELASMRAAACRDRSVEPADGDEDAGLLRVDTLDFPEL
jgi:hypothetical protein